MNTTILHRGQTTKVDINRLLTEGHTMTANQWCEEFSMSRRSLADHCKKHNIKCKPDKTGRPTVKVDIQYLRDNAETMTAKQFAAHFGCEPSTIYEHAKRNDIGLKKRGTPEANKRGPVAAQYDEDDRPVYDGIMIGCPPLSVFFSREVGIYKTKKY